MSAYLIEVRDSKEGVLYPDIIGPFQSAEEAEDFAESAGLGEIGAEGGYAAFHVIADETCDYSPNGYREQFSYKFGEEE